MRWFKCWWMEDAVCFTKNSMWVTEWVYVLYLIWWLRLICFFYLISFFTIRAGPFSVLDLFHLLDFVICVGTMRFWCLLLWNSAFSLYAQYGVLLEYGFLLRLLNILIIFFCVSVVFSHTESSFASVLFLFVFNGVALQVL